VLDAGQMQNVTELLERSFGIDALWVFGSQASGRATLESDLDLGVLFSRRPTVVQRLELQAELGARLGMPVDLVDLDTASPALAMQVLRHGQLALDRNPRHRIAFMTALPSRYEDLRRLRAPIEQKIAARMSARST